MEDRIGPRRCAWRPQQPTRLCHRPYDRGRTPRGAGEDSATSARAGEPRRGAASRLCRRGPSFGIPAEACAPGLLRRRASEEPAGRVAFRRVAAGQPLGRGAAPAVVGRAAAAAGAVRGQRGSRSIDRLLAIPPAWGMSHWSRRSRAAAAARRKRV